MTMILGHDSTEPFIALEQPVQRLQLTQVSRSERPPFALPNEPSEPLAKASRLRRDVVELPRHPLCLQRFKRFRGYQLRLLQPRQHAIAVVDPVDLLVHWRGDRVQEIQTERVGDEYGGRAGVSHRAISECGPLSSRAPLTASVKSNRSGDT